MAIKTSVQFEKLDRQLTRLIRSLDNPVVEKMTEEAAGIVKDSLANEVGKINRVTGRLADSPVVRQLQNPVRDGGPRPHIAAINRSAKKGGAPHAWLVNRLYGYFRRGVFLSADRARDHLITEAKAAVLEEVR